MIRVDSSQSTYGDDSIIGEDGHQHVKTKVFNDPIHGHIELHPILVKIIDTLEFQRLRNLKQLGALCYVYPGACHSRFEHSIGTCHLAQQLIHHLQAIHPSHITKEEALCVQIAALCHDLGHGPFSHLFDQNVIPRLKPEGYETWEHELGSIKLFDIIINNEDYGLKSEFEKYNYDIGEDEIHLIKEMIFGPMKKGTYEKAEFYQARPEPEKYFLYEVVSNKTNGIDVDKWDYFARDCKHLNIANNFDHSRFIKFCRVVQDGEKGTHHICVRDKEVDNAYEMFHTRHRLHRNAYQHTVKLALESMISDALQLAGESFVLTKPNGDTFKMVDAINDMEAYVQLDDGIFWQIIHHAEKKDVSEAKGCLDKIKELVGSDSSIAPSLDFLETFLEKRSSQKKLEAARKLLLRVVKNRDAYKVVKKKKLPKDVYLKDVEVVQAAIAEEIVQYDKSFESNNITVKIAKFNYGMKDKNPIDNLLFYSKNDVKTSFRIPKDEVSFLLPERFQEQVLYVFVKDAANKQAIAKCVDTWMEKEFNRWTQTPESPAKIMPPGTPQRSGTLKRSPPALKHEEEKARGSASRQLERDHEDQPPAKRQNLEPQNEKA
ncbi:deoxynucleoside triphosphate triphosphohydrolase SAMHD1-like [Glandiceps talaboti]